MGGNRGVSLPLRASSEEQKISSLDKYLQNLPGKPSKQLNSWTKKQRRAFQRILSGLKRSQYLGQPIRFMTLTSALQGRWLFLNRDFSVLVKRIKKHFGQFDYFKIKTNEGNGVLHVLYRGGYIPQKWLSRNWEQIHGAKIVDIRLFRSGGKRLARYISSQYLAGQTGFVRMSWSWKWVAKGFVKVWYHLIKTFGYKLALAKWDIFLENPEPYCYLEMPLLVWC